MRVRIWRFSSGLAEAEENMRLRRPTCGDEVVLLIFIDHVRAVADYVGRGLYAVRAVARH